MVGSPTADQQCSFFFLDCETLDAFITHIKSRLFAVSAVDIRAYSHVPSTFVLLENLHRLDNSWSWGTINVCCDIAASAHFSARPISWIWEDGGGNKRAF